MQRDATLTSKLKYNEQHLDLGDDGAPLSPGKPLGKKKKGSGPDDSSDNEFQPESRSDAEDGANSDESGAEEQPGDLTQDVATLVNPPPKPARAEKPYVYKPRPVVAPPSNAFASSSTYRPPIQQVFPTPPSNSLGMAGMPLSPTPNGATSAFDIAPTEASRTELRRARYTELFDRLERRAQCVDVRMARLTCAGGTKTASSIGSSISGARELRDVG